MQSNPASPPTNTLSTQSISRWPLLLEARILRLLARIGFYLHTIPKPSPADPAFYRTFTTEGISKSSAGRANLSLAFYIPPDFHHQIRLGKRYPVVLNFHGGGFTIGRPTDDARWAATVVHDVDAVVVSAQYRLAPEHPFPTAIEDGAEALLYVAKNAEELGINAQMVTISGFSAGGNMALAVPLMLQANLRKRTLETSAGGAAAADTTATATLVVPHIVAIVAWYPSLDNRLTRAERRAASLVPAKTLPPFLTDVFDASYFPDKGSVGSPYASPAAATDEELDDALPDHVSMWLCEWDMLLREGKDFEERLRRLGKQVRCTVVKERRHGFDKSPWPFGVDRVVVEVYGRATGWLRDVYGM